MYLLGLHWISFSFSDIIGFQSKTTQVRSRATKRNEADFLVGIVSIDINPQPLICIYVYIYTYGNVPLIRDTANMITCNLRVFGSNTLLVLPNELFDAFVCGFIAAAGAFFQLDIVGNDDKSCYLFLIHVYSGRRRFFPNEYCRK